MKREVGFEANLAADSGAGDMTATQQGESHGEALGELVPSPGQTLELVFPEALVVGNGAIQFRAKGDAGAEVVLQGEAPGIDVAAGVLRAENTGAGVAGEQEAKVGIDARLVGKRFLGDGVQPVVGEPGTELPPGIAGRKFDVEAGGESRGAERAGGFAEVPFDAHVGVAGAVGGRGSGRAVDGEPGCVDVELEAVRQTVVELVIESVLAEIGILGGLKAVEFVERLEVERAVVGDVGIVGVEGHLSPQKTCAANRAQRQKNDSAEAAHVEVILTVNGRVVSTQGK